MVASNSYGAYFVEVDLKSYPLCWIRNRDGYYGTFSPRPWFFLLIPLFIYYSYTMYVIRCARDMLDPNSPNTTKSSLFKTHFHRLFALDSNNRTMKIYLGYWIFFISIAVILFISINSSHFGTHHSRISSSLAYLLLLCIGGKGYIDLVVFSSILLSRSYKVCIKGSNRGEDYFHLNKGLKFQLMTFITSGLKQANEELIWSEFDNHDSRVWSITVKPNPGRYQTREISTAIHDEYLTPEQYREYLSEVDIEHPDIVVLVERTTSIAFRETLSTIFKDDSSTKNDLMGDKLLGVEIPKKTSIDETVLSKTVLVPEKSFFERFLL